MQKDKYLKSECPCCGSALYIDRETGKVMRHEKKKREIESMENFLTKEKNKKEWLDARFDKAKDSEKNRMAELEKKFKFARDNKDSLPDPKKIWD